MAAIPLPPELEQRVTQIAHEAKRTPADVLADIVAAGLELDSDQELWDAVAESRAQFERGECVPHEQVMQDMRDIIDRARARRA